MRVDVENKTVDISVREIAFSAETPISDSYISRRLRARIGQEVHSSYQKDTDGQSEYYVDFYLLVDDFYVQVRGRVDVLHQLDNGVRIEEIKSTTQSIDTVEKDPAHVLQLQIYCYYFQKFEKVDQIEAELVMIDQKGRERRFEIQPRQIEELLVNHLRLLIDEYLSAQQERQQQMKRATSFKFPYDSFRPHQQEIMKQIAALLDKAPRIMLHAPPGIGKTITTLYTALLNAVATGRRVFVITSKTTQQLVYREAIRDMLRAGAEFRAINISAKGKMCRIDEYDCYDYECPHFERYMNQDTTMIMSELLPLKLITREAVEREARPVGVCPFEISLDVALHCDVILSDFNYIFHPRVKFQRFQEEFDNSILIIDEAHNLVNRSIDYYTSELSVAQIQEVITAIKQLPVNPQLRYRISSLLRRIMKYVQQLKDQIMNLEVEHSLVEVDRTTLMIYQKKLDDLCIEYLDSLPVLPSKKDNLIKFADHFKFFTLLLKDTETPEFEEVYDLAERQVRILCKSAAKKLEEEMKRFDSVIVQSATLEPLEYYRDMLGLPENTTILHYQYPFDTKQRIYLIDNSISTTYRERYLFLDQLVASVLAAITIKDGNYLVFFSSFEYLERFHQAIMGKSDYQLLIQESEMNDQDRERFLNLLKSTTKNLVLAVMGGIFSEGIDYKGDMASGAFVVGPGLPQITFDQELRKEYFDEVYHKGFDYAYKYPGFAKVIQAGGRVFRSDTDRGFVMFVGHRFATEQYLPLIPENYQVKVENITEQLQHFWDHG